MPYIPLHISALFIALVFGIAFLIVIAVQACSRRLNLPFEEARNNFSAAIIFLLVWLMFTLIMGLSGFLDDFNSLPPRILLILVPPFVFILVLMVSRQFHELTAPLDNFWLVYAQSFRLLVELILWMLYRYKIIPVQMTFEGRNFDILVGVTAPIVAYYCFNRKVWPAWVAIVWNIAGLALLINIVSVTVLSAPYPFRVFMNEPANSIVVHFPFVWLPALVVPFAFLLHLLSLRKLILAYKK